MHHALSTLSLVALALVGAFAYLEWRRHVYRRRVVEALRQLETRAEARLAELVEGE